MTNVSVIIPALNEEEPIADVVRAVAATNIPREIIVVDNGSTDRTAERAREAGAKVVSEPDARLWPRLCSGSARAFTGMRDRCFSGRRRQRLPGVHESTCRSDHCRHARFCHRLTHARSTRARQHEHSSKFSRADSPAGYCRSCTACVTPTCVRSARSGAMRSNVVDARKTYGWNLEMQMRAARAGSAHSRSSGESSLPHRRRFESFRHIARHVRRRRANHRDACCASQRKRKRQMNTD